MKFTNDLWEELDLSEDMKTILTARVQGLFNSQFNQSRKEYLALFQVFKEIEKTVDSLGTINKDTFKQIKEQGGL